MKKILLVSAALALASPAWSAQQPITTITVPASGKIDMKTYTNTHVNPRLTAAQSNFDELYTLVSAANLTVDASGFDGNLETTDNTVQEIAQAFDDYVAGGSMTWPAAAGVMVYGGSSAYGTSLVADGDAIGELVLVHDDGAGNPALPFTLSYEDLTSKPTIPTDLSGLTDTANILTGKLSVADIDDTPVNDVTAAPISSNWAFDHVGATDPHTGYVLESALSAEVDSTQTGTHASGSTTDPLAPTWTGPMHTVWYNAAGEIDLPAAAGYTGRGILIYSTGANIITVDPNSTEIIVRDGTAQTGGVTMTLSAAAGNYVALVSDGARWVTVGFKGTLAAGS